MLQRWFFVAALVMVVTAILPDVVLGCSCPQLESACSSMRPGAVIFVGRVVSAEPTVISREVAPFPSSGQLGPSQTGTVPATRYQFEPGERFYGVDDSGTVSVVAARPEAIAGACGIEFVVGEDYLVFASADGDQIVAGPCSRTQVFDDDSPDLALLRESRRGAVQPRLYGWLFDQRIRMDGWSFSHDVGDPLAGVRVTAQGRAGAFVTRTDRRGLFVFVGLPPGEYDVVPELPSGREVVPAGNRGVLLDGCSAEVALPTIVTSLRGTSRTRDGMPVGAGVRIWAVPDTAGSPPTRERSTFTETEADGTWKFQGLRPGRYRVGVNVFAPPSTASPYQAEWHPGSSRASEAAVIDVTDSRVTQIPIRVSPRIPVRYVEGVVVDLNGVPVADGASVIVFDMADPDREASRVSAGMSGRFSLPLLEGRRYRVRAIFSSPFSNTGVQSESELQDVSDDPATPVRLVLSKPVPAPRSLVPRE